MTILGFDFAQILRVILWRPLAFQNASSSSSGLGLTLERDVLVHQTDERDLEAGLAASVSVTTVRGGAGSSQPDPDIPGPRHVGFPLTGIFGTRNWGAIQHHRQEDGKTIHVGNAPENLRVS